MKQLIITLDDKTYAQLCMSALEEEDTPEAIASECVCGGMIGRTTPDEIWYQMDSEEFSEYLEQEVERRMKAS